MYSSLYGKIEKANRYAAEKAERIHITGLTVDFKGDNDSHKVALTEEGWSCTCDFFEQWHLCCHTMALEKVLDGMLPRSITEKSKIMQPEAAPA